MTVLVKAGVLARGGEKRRAVICDVAELPRIAHESRTSACRRLTSPRRASGSGRGSIAGFGTHFVLVTVGFGHAPIHSGVPIIRGR